MNIVEKTPGTKIPYSYNKTSITFGDGDLVLNLKHREMDDVNIIDICSDKNGFLVVGTAVSLKYVAQIEIPARRYVEVPVEQENPESETGEGGNTEPGTTLEPAPFDIKLCTLYLWGMEE